MRNSGARARNANAVAVPAGPAPIMAMWGVVMINVMNLSTLSGTGFYNPVLNASKLLRAKIQLIPHNGNVTDGFAKSGSYGSRKLAIFYRRLDLPKLRTTRITADIDDKAQVCPCGHHL